MYQNENNSRNLMKIVWNEKIIIISREINVNLKILYTYCSLYNPCYVFVYMRSLSRPKSFS